MNQPLSERARHILRHGTPIERVAYPEEIFRCERVYEHSRRLAAIADAGARLKKIESIDKKALDARVKQLRRRAKKFDHIDAVKRAAARAGRTLYQSAEHARAMDKLLKVLEKLPTPILRYWAQCLLYRGDGWSGASGAGAYIAAGTQCINDISLRILRVRAAGRTVFMVETESPGMHEAEDAA